MFLTSASVLGSNMDKFQCIKTHVSTCHMWLFRNIDTAHCSFTHGMHFISAYSLRMNFNSPSFDMGLPLFHRHKLFIRSTFTPDICEHLLLRCRKHKSFLFVLWIQIMHRHWEEYRKTWIAFQVQGLIWKKKNMFCTKLDFFFITVRKVLMQGTAKCTNGYNCQAHAVMSWDYSERPFGWDNQTFIQLDRIFTLKQ